MFIIRLLPITVLLVLLSACGGGGGGSSGGGSSSSSSSSSGGTDTTPGAFAFVDQTSIGLAITVESNTITISGINAAAPISISGGEYSIDGGAYTAADGTVQSGQSVTVRQTSSDQFSTTTDATLTVGGVSDTFSVTTQAEDTTPDAFSFTAQTNAALTTPIESSQVTITGINSVAPVSITGGEYSIDSGAYTALAGTVQQGQTVRVRQTSSDQLATTTEAVLTVGGVDAVFAVTTLSEVTPPTAAILFPHVAGAVVNRSSITIRGTADDDSGVMSVSVNGVAATTSDNYANWQATIPLTLGEDPNPVSVEVTDMLGNVNASAAATTIIYRYGVQGTCSVDFGFDAANDLVYQKNIIEGIIEFDLADGARRPVLNNGFTLDRLRYSQSGQSLYMLTGAGSLYEVDAQTGTQTLVAETGLSGVQDIEIDEANGVMYVFDSTQLAIVAIDLDDGSQETVSDNSNSGGSFDIFGGAYLAFDDGRLFVGMGNFSPAIFEVDLDNGDRTVISDNSVLGLLKVEGLLADVSGGVLYAADLLGGLYEVDIGTGASSLLSAPDYANNLLFEQAFDIQLDAANGRALISSCKPGVLMAIDLADGSRSRMLSPDRGAGPNLHEPQRIAYDPIRDRVLTINRTPSTNALSIIAVDVATGDRTIVSGPSAGSGAAFQGLAGVAMDTVNDRILVTDRLADEVIAVDPVTGARTVLSGGGQGGPAFDEPGAITLDGDRALVVDLALDALIAVDLTTGDRTVISQTGGPGSGVDLDGPVDLALDVANRQAYILSKPLAALLRVDLDTGTRTVVSDAATGTGTALQSPMFMTVDLQHNVAIVPVSSPVTGLVLVDLDTGNREFKNLFGGLTAFGSTGLAVDSASGRIYIAGADVNSVGIYDIDAHSQALISR